MATPTIPSYKYMCLGRSHLRDDIGPPPDETVVSYSEMSALPGGECVNETAEIELKKVSANWSSDSQYTL